MNRHLTCLAVIIVLGCAAPSALAQTMMSEEDYGYDGFLEPVHDVLVSAVEIGRIDTVDVKVGDRVELGQQLASLESALQEISLEIAAHQAKMQGEWLAASAECAMQETRTSQLRALLQQGTARPDELARAETELQVAKARLQVATEEHESRVLEMRRQEVNLNRRKIVSPIKGIVAKVLRQPGEYISPGESAIVRVIAKDALVAVFNLPASDAMQIRVGQKVPLRPRTIPRAVEGVVESIAPAIDGESGTVAVRIRIPNVDEVLFPGDRCVMGNVRQLAQVNGLPTDLTRPERIAQHAGAIPSPAKPPATRPDHGGSHLLKQRLPANLGRQP